MCKPGPHLGRLRKASPANDRSADCERRIGPRASAPLDARVTASILSKVQKVLGNVRASLSGRVDEKLLGSVEEDEGEMRTYWKAEGQGPRLRLPCPMRRPYPKRPEHTQVRQDNYTRLDTPRALLSSPLGRASASLPLLSRAICPRPRTTHSQHRESSPSTCSASPRGMGSGRRFAQVGETDGKTGDEAKRGGRRGEVEMCGLALLAARG
ncbi:hypothetical protein CALVIDRAFT_287397 [Calocera viscosa TUFC12733]|uniref:Uncharacterized protein n=1 Tax=Calocera viscosa (strain TUFC12733) TaxID=1330018 RepID=A0A167IVR0_CALVF|nr:hypothetical protein CALVIDRAFT_287397 [Calocera viscosa TUFC12733]